ncbi:ABC transporter permease [Ruminococcus sp.]|jgi:ABC-type antimicrobial peptide transport system permease subunit|uniref:ABC transporter permease n=1 Tax=Ruminococcus sp. TaxID=41978 RepID=UPI0025E6DCF5|nr:ABC transporter permease [Ruminococcus sp.]
MLFDLLKTSLLYKPKKTLLLFFQIIVSFIVISIALSFFIVSNGSVAKLNRVTQSICKISDNYFGDEGEAFFSRADNVGALKKIYKWENTTDLFNYILISHQNVYIENKKWPENCSIYFEGEKISDAYYSLQVNPEFFRYFDIDLSEGIVFTEEDYLLDDNIPILMGSDYKNYCSIGEKIEMDYIGAILQCTVIGFIDDNSYYNNGNGIENLNNKIILPSLELTDEYDTGFALRLFLDKTTGFIQPNKDLNAIQNELTQQCLSADLLPFTIQGGNSFYLSMWGLEGNQLRSIFLSMLILVSVTTVICVSLNFCLKIRHFKKNYSIYISNGIRRKNIVKSIIIEIFILNTIAMFIANNICFLIGQSQNILLLFGIAIIMTMISSIYPISCFKKLNIATAIRGKE